MGFDLMIRRKITRKFAQSYQRAPSEKAKSLILNKFTHLSCPRSATFALMSISSIRIVGARILAVTDVVDAIINHHSKL